MCKMMGVTLVQTSGTLLRPPAHLPVPRFLISIPWSEDERDSPQKTLRTELVGALDRCKAVPSAFSLALDSGSLHHKAHSRRGISVSCGMETVTRTLNQILHFTQAPHCKPRRHCFKMHHVLHFTRTDRRLCSIPVPWSVNIHAIKKDCLSFSE